jgi:hypothetical protein
MLVLASCLTVDVRAQHPLQHGQGAYSGREQPGREYADRHPGDLRAQARAAPPPSERIYSRGQVLSLS